MTVNERFLLCSTIACHWSKDIKHFSMTYRRRRYILPCHCQSTYRRSSGWRISHSALTSLDDAKFEETIDTNLRLNFTSGIVGGALELVTKVLGGGLLRVGLEHEQYQQNPINLGKYQNRPWQRPKPCQWKTGERCQTWWWFMNVQVVIVNFAEEMPWSEGRYLYPSVSMTFWLTR